MPLFDENPGSNHLSCVRWHWLQTKQERLERWTLNTSLQGLSLDMCFTVNPKPTAQSLENVLWGELTLENAISCTIEGF